MTMVTTLWNFTGDLDNEDHYIGFLFPCVSLMSFMECFADNTDFPSSMDISWISMENLSGKFHGIQRGKKHKNSMESGDSMWNTRWNYHGTCTMGLRGVFISFLPKITKL